MEVKWVELPVDLLVRIVDNHLPSFIDALVFSGVCRSWRSACDLAELKQKRACRMPWLMLTDGNEETITADELDEEVMVYSPGMEIENDEDHDPEEETIASARRSMLDLRQEGGKCYDVECAQGYGRACWGSAHGWILTHGLDHNMYLFNPLTKARLNLPSRSTFPSVWINPGAYLRSNFIDKAIVLKVPTDDVHGFGETLIVVVIYAIGLKVAFAKPGDTRWTRIMASCGRPMDVLYRRDDLGAERLLLVNQYGDLAYFHLDEKPHTLRWFGCGLKYIEDELRAKEYDFVDHKIYIVDSGEDLLMVLRIFDIAMNEDEIVRDDAHDIDHYKTVDFKVYKFRFVEKRWEELEDLVDVALFVGSNSTMSVRATDAGCDGNCIYFTDDYRDSYFVAKDRLGGHDMGVFRMGDKVIRPLDVGNSSRTRSSYCCPLWFRPAL